MSSFRDLVKNVNAQKKTGSAYTQDQYTDDEEEKKHSSFRDMVKNVNNGTIQVGSKLNSSQVSDWYNGIKTTSQDGYSYLSKAGYKAPNTELAEKVDTFLSQSNDVGQYIRANKGSFENYEEAYNSYVDTVNYLREFQKSLNESNDYYSMYQSEDDYIKGATEASGDREKRYEDNLKKIEELKSKRSQAAGTSVYNPDSNFMMPVFNPKVKQLDDEIKALEAENRKYERGEDGYVSKAVDDHSIVTRNSDFAAGSANRNYKNPNREEIELADAMNDSSTWYFDANGVYRDAFGNELAVDETNTWYNPASKQTQVEDKLALYLNTSEDERVAGAMDADGTRDGMWSSVMTEGFNGAWEYLTEKEKDIYYYYLYESQGKADKYLADMEVELNRRRTLDRNGQWRDAYDESNLLMKIAMNIATVPAKFASTVTGTIDNAVNTLTGNDINPYSMAHGGMHFSQTIRGATAEDLDATGIKIPVLDFTLGDLYQTGMSRLDSALATTIFGGGGTVFLGMGAAQEEAYRLYQQGASAEQITLGAFSAGAAEAVFEYVSFDKLVKMGNPDTIWKWAKSALIQGGIEASEETFTEISNIITNAVIMGQQSDLAKLYEENGNDWSKTGLSLVKQVANAAFGGFIGGLGAGVTQGGKGYINTQAQYNNAGKSIMGAEGGVDALKQLANDVAGVSDAKMQKTLTNKAGKVSSETATGKNIVGKTVAAIKNADNATKVGRLYDTVQTANNQVNASANQADIAKSLERKGFNTETANDIAEALVASYNGQELTKAQEKLLKSAKESKVVQDAISNIVNNEQSTMGQRSQNIRDFNNDVTAGNFSRATGVSLDVAKEFVKGNRDAVKESFAESHYEVSTDGKTIDKDGNIIDIVGIESVKDGKIMLKTENGTVDASDVSFATQDEAFVYSAISNMDISPASAWALVKGFNKADGVSAQVYAIDIPLAYKYGKLNYKAGLQNLSLTPGQSATAFQMGRSDAEASVNTTENASTETTITEKNADKKIIFEGFTYNEKTAKENQKASMAAIDMISKMSNLEIHVYQSYKKNGKLYAMVNGKERIAPNGYFTDGNKVYIDINAGNKGEGLMLYTLSHEVGHYIAKWNAQDFKAISDFLFEHYGQNVPIDRLLEIQKNKLKASYKKDGKPIPSEAQLEKEAHEELVCDMLSRMLADKNAYDKLMELKQKDLNTFEKLGQAIKKALTKIAKAIGVYDTQNPDFMFAASVENFGEEAFRQLQDLYIKAFVQADANFQTAQEQFSTDSIRGNADGAVAQSEVTTALVEATDGEIIKSERTEYEALPKQVMSLSTGAGTLLDFIEGLNPKEIKGIAGKTINGYTGRAVRAYAMGISGFTEAQIKEVNKFMDAMSEFMDKAGVTYKFIGLKDVKDAKLHYTYNADGSIKSIVLSAMVKNGDYPVNFDLSSICKKRVAMSKLIDKLAKRGSLDSGTVKLTPSNIFKINTALKDAGYETACLGCFVESKRYNSLEWAKTFCNKWNAAVKKVNPNATYFGYGDNTFNEDSFTLEQAVKIDEAATKYLTTTKVERLANALKKYKAREQDGLPLVEKFSDAAKKRLVKSETISDELKDKYLNCDVTTLTMADVEFLLENEVLPGASLSNKQAVTEMVKSGEAYQHLLRPSDLLTDRGISKLEALPNFHGVLYGHYGSGTPKLMQSYTPYNSEIALLPANKNNDQTLAEYLYTIAGVRMQSFSDFQIQNIYDYLQMVADLAARKLPAHAYTKEISFAKLLGMTGIKVNLSVMFDIDPMVDKAHAGLTRLNKLIHRGEYAKVVLEDEQGKWVYNIGDYQTQKLFAEAFPDEAKRFLQSIGFGDAVKLQSTPGYSANCGIIGVGYSDLGIFAMLNDNRIRYIIPYHASSLPAEIKLATNIALGTDYTSYQNNMKIAGIVDRNGNAVNWSIKEAYKRLGSGQAVINELNNKVRNEGWVVTTKKAQTGHGTYGLYEDLQQTNDPRQTAGNFVDWCIGNGTLPLFYQFASHENYYKLLYDFNVYDCVTEEYAPQQAVTNTYPTMADGEVQPGNVTDGNFDAEYFQGTIDKQMAFMDEYSRNLDENLESLADNMENGTLFSDRDYARQVDEVKNNTHDQNNHVYMGSTPTGIANILELPKLPMLVTSQHIYSMAVSKAQAQREGRYKSRFNYHNLGWDTVKKLPEYINKPVLIIKSNTDPNDATFVVVTAETDNAGSPIIAAVKPNGTGNYFNIEFPTNFMLSGYGKDGIQGYVATAKTENRILYASKKNSQKNKNTPSVQFADNILSSDYTANLAEFKKIVKSKFAGTIFENSGLPKFSDRDFLADDNLKSNYTVSEIGEMFDAWNSNADTAELAKKVFAKLQSIQDEYANASWGKPYGIRFATNERMEKAFYQAPLGVFKAERNSDFYGITYNLDRFNNLDNQRKANVLLHEAIHACTVNYIKSAESRIPKHRDVLSFKAGEDWSNEAKAGLTLIQIFEQVRTSESRTEYGQKDAYEMTAELSNPEFRDLLKKQNLWNRVVDAIKRILGIDTQTNALDAASKALEQILEIDNARYSERTSNKELAEMDETALYIKNTNKANYIGMIFNGTKTEETRSRRTLDAFIGSDFYVTDGKYVYGSIVLGEPHKYTEEDFHKKENQRKHRVPNGDQYDIKPGGIKWAYPIESYNKFDKPKKLSDSTEYKNSFQAREVLYQDRSDESVSNRSLLANAFDGLAKDDIERNKIREYKEHIDLINAEEQKLRELNAQIKELSFAKGPRDTKKINALRFDANQAANRINTYDRQLLRLEASKPLQDVLAREKKLAYKKAEQRGKEALDAYKESVAKTQRELLDRWQENRKTAVAKVRETAEKRDAREKLNKLVLDTAKWISYPAKADVKCPDILKQPYTDFLNSIDLSSKRVANGGDPTKNDLRLANAMGSLATALDRIMTAQDPTQDSDKILDTGYLDLPADFVQKLRDMTENIKAMMVEGDYVVNNMTASEVRQLSQMIRTLNHAIKTMSKLYANLRFANIEALGFDTMEFMDALGEIEKTSDMKGFVQWDNALPYYAFKRFGKGGESVFEGLMDAQDKLAFLAKEIFAFQEKTWTGKEAKAWSEDTHTITLPNGNELTLTTADAMSIYCLSRREQGLQHLLGGGTRVIGLQKGSQKAKDSRSMLTIEDVSAIISTLTDRQKQVAEGIQEFMSTVCSEWGNEISMKRFLTRDFAEKHYFPIESNDENLPTKDPAAQQSDLFRLLNISATKPLTPGANNEVIIRNVFDVFTGHASDMARLNAYGMALLDYMKWLNYREKTVTDEGQVDVKGVRKSMEKAFGNAAKSYVLNLVKDVNGRPSDGGDPNILMKWMRAAKTASVGSSFRVATLQITSYPRAALVLSPKSLTLGLSKLPNINKAKQYCGIALWKSFGFYDTNISRSIEDQMKGVTDVKQKLIELSLKGAEWGDAITWGALWNACEYEVASTKKFKVGTEEFYQEVGKKLREVVYRTQVVDSTLTRSQIMRSKRGMAQEAAAFMSEPTLSANILMDAGFEFTMEKRRTGSAKVAWKKTGKYIGRAVAVYAIGQLAAALLESFWDAWRDDEDEEFKEKYIDAFVENLVLDLAPFNKIPIISDLAEALLSMVGLGYFSSDKMSSTWLTQAVSAVDAWKDVLSGESSVTVYNALYKTTRAFSSYVGVSVSGAMREVVAMWNNTAGAYDSTLKFRSWDLSNADLGAELYEAIISGNTRQADSIKAQFEDTDAMHSAIRKALRENDPRIEEAAVAGFNGDPSERVRIAKLIIADGFDQDDVVAAINSEVNEMEPDEPKGDPKKKGFYTAEDFATEIANGDQASANAAKDDIIQTAVKNGKTQKEAEEAFISSAKTAFRKMFVAGTLNESKATEALKTYCPTKDGPMDDDDIYWTLREWKYEKSTGSSDGYGKYNDFHTAVQTGKNLKTVIKEYTDHGVEAKTLASQITSYFKPLYKEMSNTERAGIKGYLLNAYQLLGYNRSEKSKDIDKWLKD